MSSNRLNLIVGGALLAALLTVAAPSYAGTIIHDHSTSGGGGIAPDVRTAVGPEYRSSSVATCGAAIAPDVRGGAGPEAPMLVDPNFRTAGCAVGPEIAPARNH